MPQTLSMRILWGPGGFRSAAAALLLLLSAGCSGFGADYRRSVRAARAAPSSFEGAWEGRWKSHKGHGGGGLRCVLTRTGLSTYASLADSPGPAPGASAGHYLGRFESTYWGVLRGDFTTPLAGDERAGVLTLSGDKNLGWLAGGAYHYEGRVTATEFTATYKSKADEGEFTMTRPHR